MQIVIEDRRLLPVRDKVLAGERLSFDDGLALYRTNDILSVGYLANIVRERLHGDTGRRPDGAQRDAEHEPDDDLRGQAGGLHTATRRWTNSATALTTVSCWAAVSSL